MPQTLSPTPLDSSVIHVIDDDEAFRRSLVFLLHDVGWSVASYASATDFLSAHPTPATHNGCILLDIRMPVMSGLELQHKLLEQGWQLPIIIITGHGDIELAVQAMKQGACEFLTKPFRDQVLIDAVAAAVRLNAQTQEKQTRQHMAISLLGKLSPREEEVALLLARGLPNKRIAQLLHISEKTVHIHRQHVMEKMAISSAAQLARLILHANPAALDEPL